MDKEELELIEEAQIVLEEQADVGDAVLSHGESLDTETESPAGVFFAINADGVEHVRVHHAAAAHLHPAFAAAFIF